MFSLQYAWHGFSKRQEAMRARIGLVALAFAYVVAVCLSPSARAQSFQRVSVQGKAKIMQIASGGMSVWALATNGHPYIYIERRVAERTAQLITANKELEAFSYSVSHDLRSPLRHIAGFAYSLAEDHGEQLPPEARDQLERILEGARKMGRMIDDLLNLSRLERSDMDLRMTSLNSLIDNVRGDLEPIWPGAKSSGVSRRYLR
ncbi:MAG TPA: histidine kinase dimerization/phospho-acceptor domain-containing protein [Terriglobales bacterium]